MQEKLVSQVLKLLKSTPTENVVQEAVSSVSSTLNESVNVLKHVVKDLKGELQSSKDNLSSNPGGITL